jgi:hypothetical protein
MDRVVMTPLTLRQLQAPDDEDANWQRANINQQATVEAMIDLHVLLGMLGCITVADAVKEVEELQSYKRTFGVLVRNLGGWKE